MSPGNIKHINKVLSQDRKLLIEKLKDLQEVTIRAQKAIDELAQEGSDSKHIVETFEILKRSVSEATSEAINGLSMTKVPMHKQKSSNELEEKLRVQHKEMESLIAQMLQLKHQQSTYGHRLSEHEDILEASGAKAKAEIKEGFNLLKENKPELYAYCKIFYWTTINLFGAYRNLSTNLIEGNINSTQCASFDGKDISNCRRHTDLIE